MRFSGNQHQRCRIIDVRRRKAETAYSNDSGYIPISAVGFADHIVETLREAGGMFVHGYTYSGHPTAAAVGLPGAVEIVAKPGTNARFGGAEGKAGPVVRDLCIAHGVKVRAVRDTIVMSPPLVISHAEIDRIVDVVATALDEAKPLLAKIALRRFHSPGIYAARTLQGACITHPCFGSRTQTY
jgi:acetylornithine/succinyldiaminopimelate/putrescine aminotransferase